MPSLLNHATALVRFTLLAAQVALVSGLSFIATMCIEGCGGYGQIFYAIVFGGFFGASTFTMLALHYVKFRDRRAAPLFLRSRVQWTWLAVSILALMLMFL